MTELRALTDIQQEIVRTARDFARAELAPHVAEWDRTGRALYLADFLEPGRPFLVAERAALAARVPVDFDTVFRDVVRLRLEWTLREGKPMFPETVELWNRIR